MITYPPPKWQVNLINKIPKHLDNIIKYFWYIQCKYNLLANILFAKYLKQLDKKYCFMSRDCYFLFKLYKIMYPEDNNSVYFWCSREAFKNRTPTYIKYVSKYVDEKYTFVDLGGTNKTYYNFMESCFGVIPPKILLILYNTDKDVLKNLDYLFTLDQVDNCKIEEFNRSPEKSHISDVINNIPIYSNNYNDENDIYLEECLKCYNYIFNNISQEDLTSINYDKNYLQKILRNIQYF